LAWCRSYRNAPLRDRQRETEYGAPAAIVLSPKPSAVRLDNVPRYRESHAHPFRLRGEKRIENPLEFLGWNALTRITYGDFYGLRFVKPRGQTNQPVVSARSLQ
jgi:hypothetical protein